MKGMPVCAEWSETFTAQQSTLFCCLKSSEERHCLLSSDLFALLSSIVQKFFLLFLFFYKAIAVQGLGSAPHCWQVNIMCRREISKGILPPQGDTWKAVNGDMGKPWSS